VRVAPPLRAKRPIDLGAGYAPLPAQGAFHASSAQFRCYGGAFGAGKTKAGSREVLRTAIQYPNSLGIVGRLHYRRLKDSTMRTFFRELNQTGLDQPGWTTYQKADMELDFFNGSKVMFRNLEDYGQFQGVEPDYWFIDEGAEAPDAVFRILAGRLRGTPHPEGKHVSVRQNPHDLQGPPIEVRVVGPLKAWICTNPGPSKWIRENFLQDRGPNYFFVNAKTTDNPFLPDSYIETLRAQFPGVWWKRFAMGDWTAFEGQVFTQFDPDMHVLHDPSWRPRKDMEVICGWDFGYRNLTAIVFIAVDPYGEEPPVVFAEHGAPELEPKDHVAAYQEIARRYDLDHGRIRHFGDPAGGQRQGITGKSYLHAYMDLGVPIIPSVKQPVVRSLRLAEFLESRVQTPRGLLTPGIVFHARCKQTIDSVLSLRWRDDTRTTGEDPAEKFHKENDHHFDALTYGLAALEPPKKRETPAILRDPSIGRVLTPRLARELQDAHERMERENDDLGWMHGMAV
jgi:phage terminase large subunit